ncbi:MAG: hypothetical protein PVS3B3_20930 [Ktedonobacteraceae bacterium]
MAAFVVVWGLDALEYLRIYVGVLRVSKAGELEGLDLHEHGASAYPEYALGVSTPSASASLPTIGSEAVTMAED